MGVVAICSVADVAREAEFFAGFGFEAIEPGDGYLPLTAAPGSGVIGLRSASETSASTIEDARPRSPYLVELGAETSEPFDALAGRLQADGYPATTVEDDSGLWVRVTDPDGAPLEVRPPADPSACPVIPVAEAAVSGSARGHTYWDHWSSRWADPHV